MATKYPRVVLVRMTEDMHEALLACAEREERPLAMTIRRACREYVEKSER